MKIINDTGLQLAWIPGKLKFPADSLTLVAKGTYQLVPGGVAAFAEDDQELFSAEIYEDEQPGMGCLYDGDFAYFKPRADALLLGTCHCPGGKPQTGCRVSFSVGGLRKSLAVYGDYFSGGGTQASQPQPFTSMPIHYGNSYGGEGYGANPIGKGACTITDSHGRQLRPLPNIQEVGPPMTADRPPSQPAGFGPLDRTWAQRMSAMGTYDAEWEKQRWPWFPADFDWGALNAAPGDQQIKGFLRGDEPLAFENLHPEHADYRSRLPGIRVRCFLQEQDASGAATGIREVEMRLDTLWIDMDKERLVLQWRGPTPVRSQKYEELQKVLLVTEPIGEVVSAGTYHKRFAVDSQETEAQEQAELDAEADAADLSSPDAPPAAEPPDMAAIEAEVKQEVAGELDAMIARQPRSAAAIKRVKAAILSEDPNQALNALVAEANVDMAAFDRSQELERERVKKVLEKHGLDPGVMDEAPEAPPSSPPPPPATPTLEDYEAQAAAGAGLAGEDLSGVNLRGANLRGADLKDTILSHACLAGADLTGADLTGAVLEETDLGAATLTGATLQYADLSRARLAGANLDKATLDNALFDGAHLEGASLINASAVGTLFLNTALTDARLDRTCLDGADFAGSNLDRAVLNEASLIRASMGNAAGDSVTMVGADLTELRAGDGCRFENGQFARIRGDGSTWCGAQLAGADFSTAGLVRADFSGAQLTGAKLNATELRNADLSETDLTSAQVVRANLFQASLKLANLTGTNLSGSNCFQAEFWDAILDRTQMSGTNLKMTKLVKAGS